MMRRRNGEPMGERLDREKGIAKTETRIVPICMELFRSAWRLVFVDFGAEVCRSSLPLGAK